MSPLFGRRSRLPEDVRARSALPPGEKVLAAARAADGSWLLGTRDALVVVATVGSSPGGTRIPWELVESADWDRDEERLRVREVAPGAAEAAGRRPAHEFVLPEPGPLLAMVRERVTASVLLTRRIGLAGRRGLTVVARRPPRGAGEVAWSVRYDAGVDPANPAVAAVAEQAVRTAREELGGTG